MFLKGRKGMALIICYLVIVILTILGSAFLVRSVSENRLAQRERDSIQAFYLAEAAIDRAIDQLEQDYNWNAGYTDVPLGEGHYSLTVNQDGTMRRLTATGFIPDSAGPRATQVVETSVQRFAPEGFYDNALYVAGEVDLNGNSYSVDGNVIYGDGPIDNTDNVTGTITQDDSASPLPTLDFSGLYAISIAQGNVYDAQRLDDVKHGLDSFPAPFWFNEAAGEPNIVYVEADLVLNGNIGSVGGFFVVVGDVLTNPDDTEDTTINGNGQIDGCVYTTGKFRINGGAGGLSVDGGVWAGTEAELNGNANIAYRTEYMQAIESLKVNPDIEVVSWRKM